MTVSKPATDANTDIAKKRVLVVEDNELNQKLFCDLIGVCGADVIQTRDGLKVMEIARAEKPDLILMDVFLPRMSGIECTARLKAMQPGTPIVMLTASDEDEILFLALESGADGYLLKRTKPADFRAAMLDVLSGGAPMTSEIARHVVASFRRRSSGLDPSISLSAREEETLVLLTKGYSNKEIADQLSLSIETVRSHLKNIYTKMHVRSRTEAVAHYMSRRPG